MIYLDHNATTALRPEVAALMTDMLGRTGNASSVHAAGRRARAAVEEARGQVAALCAAQPKNVIFTGGATEANNTVLKHFAGQTILIGATEHPSVAECVPEARRIPTHNDGLPDMESFARLLRDTTPRLVSVMLVNNETGVINPVAEMAAMARAAGALVHCDAVQAAGRITIDMDALGVDYLTLSAHKMGGPQGAGALIVKPAAPEVKLLHGGGQERNRRAGTENVAAIAGFGLAADIAAKFQGPDLAPLRDRIETQIPGITVFGQNSQRVANTTCFALEGTPADTQMMALDLAGICVSSGAACSSGTVKPSRVLEAMNIPAGLARCALRVSLGWNTTAAEVENFIRTYKDLQKTWRK